MKLLSIFILGAILLCDANAEDKPFAQDKQVSFIATSQLPQIVHAYKQMGFNYNRSNNECKTIGETLFVGYTMTPSQRAYTIKFCLNLVQREYDRQ